MTVRPLIHVSALLAALVLTGCGSTSAIRSADTVADKPAASAEAAKEAATVDLSGYSSVVVLDFENKVLPSNKSIGQSFADKIALAVSKSGKFNAVERQPMQGKAIRIDGIITRYDEGDAAMRFLVGFGAGSSYFESLVRLSDNETGKPLGEIVVDKNSWVLGGGIAATQDVNSHMQSAAETIADNLSQAKADKPVTTAQASGS